MEQETEEKEEVEESEEKEIDEEKLSRVRIMSERTYNPVYKSKEFLEKLEENYINTQNYSETASRLNKIFKTTITPGSVKRIYTKRLAYKIANDKGANEFFEDGFNKMKDRWNDAWEMVGDLVKQYKKLREQLDNTLDDQQKALLLLKMSPTIIQIAQEIRKQLEFIQNQQEQIKIQQTTMIMSPIEISNQIGPILKVLIEEGRISINRDIPEFGIDLDKKEKNK